MVWCGDVERRTEMKREGVTLTEHERKVTYTGIRHGQIQSFDHDNDAHHNPAIRLDQLSSTDQCEQLETTRLRRVSLDSAMRRVKSSGMSGYLSSTVTQAWSAKCMLLNLILLASHQLSTS